MKDPVVLITGALTGIGRAAALAFANEGGRIVASGRRLATPEQSIVEISRLVGFRTLSHFTTALRDVLGVTPEAYRAAAVQEAPGPATKEGEMDRAASVAERTSQEPGADEQPRRFHRKSIDLDAALVAQLRRTDTGAAEALVGAYGDRVYRLAIRITGNASDAEEVVQDAFSRVLRHIGTFRGDASLGSWIYRIVANAAYQNVRRRRHRRDKICLEDVLPSFREDGRHAGPISDWSARIDDPAAQTELRAALGAAIDDLPPAYRVAIVLRDVEGSSMREVADALKISVANAKSRVHRGRLFLRKRLAIYVGSAEAMPSAVGGSPGVDRPHRPYQPRESEHSAGQVAIGNDY